MTATPGYVVITLLPDPAGVVPDGAIVTVTAAFYSGAGVPTGPTAATYNYALSGATTNAAGSPFVMTGTSGVYTGTIDTTGFCAGVSQYATQVEVEVSGTGTCQSFGRTYFTVLAPDLGTEGP